MKFPSSPRRETTPGAPRGARRRLRPWLAPFTGGLAAMALMLAPSLASADSSSTLTVVGTSDVSDSGLIPTLIQPLFHQAYPQYTFKYIGTATGTAIADAENGSVGASVLIVHAASLENQFVAGGYSYEPFGRALWTNDFVLAGPAAQDPAGVSANASTNIVQAFADIANAGYNAGGATPADTFVSRGGTPGTTVQEHQFWAQVAAAGLTSADNAPATAGGFYLCAVDASLGGGDTPIKVGNGVTANGQPCPAATNGTPQLPPAAELPDWYVATGLTQGPNVALANACTAGTGGGAGIASPANTCYVFTDRGTYDYLLSGYSPPTATYPAANTDQVANLTIRTRNLSTLTNYFHGYIINPAKSPAPVNLPAAQAFINFITSPTVQSQLGNYLNATSDPGGAPFVADASPAITAAGLPSTVAAGQPVTVTGTVTNLEPGYAAPAAQPVSVDELVGGVPVAVASGTTTSTGAYSITFTPPSSGSYQVATGLITLAESQLGLTPAYGDELSPGASTATSIAVQAAATIGKVTTSAGTVSAAGSILPAALDANSTATLLARPQSSAGAFQPIGTETLPKGQATYAVNGSLKGGKWTIEVQYADPGSLTTATTATTNVTVPANSVKVSFRRLRSKQGKVILSGRLSQGPTTTSATVKLFALSVGKLSVKRGKSHGKTTHRKHAQVVEIADASRRLKFKQVAKVKVKTGRTRYTLKHTFARGHRYVLQLEYIHKGQTSTYSKYRYLNVH
jgi:tungstate transport system substrate-binding protein